MSSTQKAGAGQVSIPTITQSLSIVANMEITAVAQQRVILLQLEGTGSEHLAESLPWAAHRLNESAIHGWACPGSRRNKWTDYLSQ